jgi:acetyl-CoA synthetase
MSTPAPSAPTSIDSTLRETRKFHPPHPADAGMSKWYVDSMDKYRQMHRESIEDPSGFWETHARNLHWMKPWSRVLDWNPPDAKWFVNGKINACDNCLDRQVKGGFGDQPCHRVGG